jgi:outer membrane protein assembly factor BamB
MSSWGKRQIFRIKIIYIIILLIILLPVCHNKNHRPNTPDIPAGPTIGRIDYAYNFSIEAIDADEDSVAVRCYWGGGDTSDWSPFDISGKVILLSHLWSDTGIYYIKAQVKDNSGLFSHWSEPCAIRIIIDEPPLTPTILSGQDSGKINISYDFSTSTIDPDGDKIAIRFDWGTGDTSDWSFFHSSDDTITTSYTWINPRTYLVKAQAKDVYDMTSGWSEVFPVMITNLGTVKWRFHTSDFRAVATSPAIGSDGTIYFGALNDTLYALNPDGTLKWSYSTNRDIYSSPAIGSDGTIYFGSYDNYLYALHPDGSLKWKYDAGTSIHTSPAIGADGTIYFGQLYGEYHHGDFNALNPDGSLKWSYPTDCDIYSSPAIGSDGTIYFGTYSIDNDNYLYALNPDGSLKWGYSTGHGNCIYSSPAIGSDGTIYFIASDWYLYAMNSDGTLKWRIMWPVQFTPTCYPAISLGDTIYASTMPWFNKINPDGTWKWKAELWPNGPPTICSDGTIYFAGNGGFCAINPDSTMKWFCQISHLPSSPPAIGPDGTIYAGSADGYLYAIQGSGQLANTPWPKFRHDSKNTGRFGGP